jgi:hypothetical protein
MRTIWRFDVNVTDRPCLTNVPVGATFLHVAEGDRYADQLTVWAIVDDAAPLEVRYLRVHGTGNPIDEAPGRHLGTFASGSFVWHVFEEPS